jgi:hypothetical protein
MKTHRENVFRKYGLYDTSYSLKELSHITKIPLSILQQVYDRGIGAYKTNPPSVRMKHSFVKNVDAPPHYKLSKEQWAYARVYSFIDGNKKHDNDLRENLNTIYKTMPYYIQKVPRKNLYWVVDDTGKHYSKEGLKKEMAKKQLTALNLAHLRKTGRLPPHLEGSGVMDVWNSVKDKIGSITTSALSKLAETGVGKKIEDAIWNATKSFGKKIWESGRGVEKRGHGKSDVDTFIKSVVRRPVANYTEDQNDEFRKMENATKTQLVKRLKALYKSYTNSVRANHTVSADKFREVIAVILDLLESHNIPLNRIVNMVNRYVEGKDEPRDVGVVDDDENPTEGSGLCASKPISTSTTHTSTKSRPKTTTNPIYLTGKPSKADKVLGRGYSDVVSEVLRDSGAFEDLKDSLALNPTYFPKAHEKTVAYNPAFHPTTFKGKTKDIVKDAMNKHMKDRIKEQIKKGRGAMPSKGTLVEMGQESYKGDPRDLVEGYTLVKATPTLKFYKSNTSNTIVVAIRGTKPTDVEDIKADSLIPINLLETSNRYRKDEADLKLFQSQYPPTKYDYYGVGHSLGGAILDAFLRGGYLKMGVSYNPAIQLKDLSNRSIRNHRIYSEGDALYKLFGSKASMKPEVRKGKPKGIFSYLISKIPKIGDALSSSYDYVQNHALDQFKGGVNISKKEFVKEHKKLVGILKSGSKGERLKEAIDQLNELKRVEGGSFISKLKEGVDTVRKTLKGTTELFKGIRDNDPKALQKASDLGAVVNIYKKYSGGMDRTPPTTARNPSSFTPPRITIPRRTVEFDDDEGERRRRVGRRLQFDTLPPHILRSLPPETLALMKRDKKCKEQHKKESKKDTMPPPPPPPTASAIAVGGKKKRSPKNG